MEPVAGSTTAVIEPVWIVRRIRQICGALLLVTFAFMQSGTATVADTKLDLVVSPGRFLARSLQAWDPQAAFGELQNQAYGYLWPMGSFFWLGDRSQVPDWLIQRLWWCVVLVVAYLGMLRLLALWRVGSPNSRIVAALFFAASAHSLAALGAISIEVWPAALLPWILVPLVRIEYGIPIRSAAFRSALVVACTGGVNAVASVTVLVVPLLYILTRPRSRDRLVLLGYWLVGVFLATAWWVLPLVVLGRYAYPFLDQIEGAATTTAPESLINLLRGVEQWIGFLSLNGGPSWVAGYWWSTAALGIVATSAIACMGLAGLLSPRLTERRFLALCALAGVIVMGLGYSGSFGSPMATGVRGLLDGSLAPLRNVHKFDALIRLPLCVGIAYLLSSTRTRAATLVGRLWPSSSEAAVRRGVAVSAAVVVLIPLLVNWSPALGGSLAARRSFPAIDAGWAQAATYLAEKRDGRRTLLVPGSNFAEYTWGRPMDEPFGALTETPWAIRNAVPLGAPGATRLLDGIDVVLRQGRGSADLAPALQSAGVGWLVLRNDLDPTSGVQPSSLSRATLLGSPGIVPRAEFGDGLPRSLGMPIDTQAEPALRLAIEIFEVVATQGGAETWPQTELASAAAGPEALASGELSPRAPWVLGPDVTALPGSDAESGSTDQIAARRTVTDTFRRRIINFGAQRGMEYSPTLTTRTDVLRGRRIGDVTLRFCARSPTCVSARRRE